MYTTTSVSKFDVPTWGHREDNQATIPQLFRSYARKQVERLRPDIGEDTPEGKYVAILLSLGPTLSMCVCLQPSNHASLQTI